LFDQLKPAAITESVARHDPEAKSSVEDAKLSGRISVLKRRVVAHVNVELKINISNISVSVINADTYDGDGRDLRNVGSLLNIDIFDNSSTSSIEDF
jgi:hypothetical protein